jgi:hypothetical protein
MSDKITYDEMGTVNSPDCHSKMKDVRSEDSIDSNRFVPNLSSENLMICASCDHYIITFNGHEICIATDERPVVHKKHTCEKWRITR